MADLPCELGWTTCPGCTGHLEDCLPRYQDPEPDEHNTTR